MVARRARHGRILLRTRPPILVISIVVTRGKRRKTTRTSCSTSSRREGERKDLPPCGLISYRTSSNARVRLQYDSRAAHLHLSVVALERLQSLVVLLLCDVLG